MVFAVKLESEMYSFLVYCFAVVIYIGLFWFYKPSEVSNKQPVNGRRRRKQKKTNSILEVLGLTREEFSHFIPFGDRFDNYEAVIKAISRAGLESANLIIGVDFTASNEWQGRKTCNGHSLHKISGRLNPYQRVISILGQTIEGFQEDNVIPAYGFGDSVTRDRDIFNLKEDDGGCFGFKDVLDSYNSVVRRVILGGPTNFAPLIQEAVRIVHHSRKYNILVIIADGQVTEEQLTIDAIVEASNYAMSIIVIGVGDGPWDMMNDFDNELPKRKFDNFQFVDYHSTYKGKNPDLTFALHSLMEIPDQYKTIKSLGYLDESLPQDTTV